jgi:hypothetical protein
MRKRRQMDFATYFKAHLSGFEVRNLFPMFALMLRRRRQFDRLIEKKILFLYPMRQVARINA